MNSNEDGAKAFGGNFTCDSDCSEYGGAYSVCAKNHTVAVQQIYNNVKIVNIEDVTGRTNRIFPPDVAMRVHSRMNFDFQTQSGGKYIVQSFGSLHNDKVGFYLESKNDNKKIIYSNTPRFAQWFRVYRITTTEPHIELWGILSDRGAATSSIISGFYVFMDKNGVLEPVLTDKEMDEFGMAFDSHESNPPGYAFSHMLKREIVNGDLRMEYAYQYWYGHMAHSQASYVVENVGYLSWNNTAQTFELIHEK